MKEVQGEEWGDGRTTQRKVVVEAEPRIQSRVQNEHKKAQVRKNTGEARRVENRQKKEVTRM